MKTRRITLIFLMNILAVACNLEKEELIHPSENSIQYTGRIDQSNPDSVLIYWSGTSVKALMKGTCFKVRLSDASGNNFFNVFVDGDTAHPRILDLAKGDSIYTISDSLNEGYHSIELFRRTEGHEGTTAFLGFISNGRGKTKPLPSLPSLKLEFYGNSITSATGVEDFSRKNNGDISLKNNFYSYARMTSTALNAQYHCISLGGIGIMVSWFDRIMPEVYYRLDPADSSSHWDFSKYRPDIVVINLFQNDSWLVEMPDHKEFIRRFPDGMAPDSAFIVNAHSNFVRQIRKEYPNAPIICALGNMDATEEGSPWPGYVQASVDQMKTMDHDSMLYTCFFPYKNTPAHPTVDEEKVMADQLVEFIRKNILINNN